MPVASRLGLGAALGGRGAGVLYDASVVAELRADDDRGARRPGEASPGPAGWPGSPPRSADWSGRWATTWPLSRSAPSSPTPRSSSATGRIFKLIRRFEPGINPAVELGRFLGERARFGGAPKMLGHVEYQAGARHPVGHGRRVGGAGRQRGRRLGLRGRRARPRPRGRPGRRATPTAWRRRPRRACSRSRTGASSRATRSSAPTWSGRRCSAGTPPSCTMALGSDRNDPAMAPEPLSVMDRQAMFHGGADPGPAGLPAGRLGRGALERTGRGPGPRVRDRRASAGHRVGAPRGGADPLPRGLPPRPGALDRQGLRHHRLRGRAHPVARAAPVEAPGDGRPGRHDPVLPLRLEGGGHPGQPRPDRIGGLRRAGPVGPVAHPLVPVGGRHLPRCLPQGGEPRTASCPRTAASWPRCSTSASSRRRSTSWGTRRTAGRSGSTSRPRASSTSWRRPRDAR